LELGTHVKIKAPYINYFQSKVKTMMPDLKSSKGMTLIEITVAMAVSFIVAGAIFATYRTQKMTHMTQRALVEMNQNVRSAVYFMGRDLRMAGSDPSFGTLGNPTGAGAGFIQADVADMQFTVDWDRSGSIDQNNETIRYVLRNDAGGDGDANDDGICDATPCHLGRQITGGNLEIIAENVDALDFEYLGYSNTNDAVLLNPWPGTGGTVPNNQLNNIRFVRMTLVGRYSEDRLVMAWNRTDNRIYQNASGRTVLPAQNDDMRRSAMTTEVQLRNRN
jgi:type II secretory pathway component PulJ